MISRNIQVYCLRFVPMALLLLAALVVGGIYFWALRPWGPWAFSDSVDYVDEARNLLQGQGLVSHTTRGELVFVSHYPPGYPVLLALGMRFLSGDWLAAGRWIDVVSLVLFLVVAGRVMFEAVGVWPAGLVTMISLAVLPPLTRLFLGLMSEPPFLVLEMVGVYLLWRYALTEKRSYLYGAGLVMGLAVLVRYAGLYALPVLFLIPWLFSPSLDNPLRMRHSLNVTLLVLFPFGIWGGFSLLKKGVSPRHWTPVDLWLREAQFFLRETPQVFQEALKHESTHTRLPLWGVMAFWTVAALLLFWGVWRWRQGRWRGDRVEALALVTLFLAWAWFPALALMRVFVSPSPAINLRMYTPAFALWVLSFWAVFWGWVRGKVSKRWRLSALGLVLSVGLLLAVGKSPYVSARFLLQDMHAYGQGFTARPWHIIAHEGVLHQAALLPRETPLFSNRWEAVLLWLGRPAQVVYLEAWLQAAKQGQLENRADYQNWRQSQGALVVLWPQGKIPKSQKEVVALLGQEGVCLRDEGGWLCLPKPFMSQEQGP